MIKKIIEKFRRFFKLKYVRPTLIKLNRYSLFTKVAGFFKHYIIGLFNRLDDHHVFLLAGGLAFSLFVCIIPFILIIFSLLGNFLDSGDIQFQIDTLIDTIIPYSQYSSYAKEIIFSRINEVIEYKTVAGVVGITGLLFAASGLFSSMRTILNNVFAVDTDVHFIIAKLWDFALVLMVIILFFAATITMPLMDVLRQSANKWKILSFMQSGIFEYFLFSSLSLLLIFIIFTVLYITVPIKKLSRRATIISALWAAVLWEGAKQIFGYYIYNFSSFGKIYGTYALVVVLAFWIYYSSVVFIIGAEIGRLYNERRYKLSTKPI